MKAADFQRLAPAALVACCMLVSNLHAGLTWESLVQSGVAEPGAREVGLRFPFTNQTGNVVEITKVRSSCGCISTRLSGTRIEPGASGELLVTFTVGNRVGRQRKVVSVWERGEKAPRTLTVDIQLPEPVVVQPGEIEWAKGETPTRKAVTIRPGEGIRVGKVTVTNPDFILFEKSEGGERTLEIDPKNAVPPLTALLRIAYEGKASGTVAIPVRME